MRLFSSKTLFAACLCCASLLSACYKPPYNNFEPSKEILTEPTEERHTGFTIFKSKKKRLINILNNADIQYVEYGDTHTLIIPTDRYFEYGTPRFNELCYKTFNNILMLLRLYRCSQIHIAGFTDHVGTDRHLDTLTQARAETMLTYLWANGFKSAQLSAEGYGRHYPVANDVLIHGSAHNRRLEIQWFQFQNCRQPTIHNEYITK